MKWQDINALCDVVRETSFAIHKYLRNSYLKKIWPRTGQRGSVYVSPQKSPTSVGGRPRQHASSARNARPDV